MTFGNVPHPPFIDRLIPDIQNRAWDDLGSRNPAGARHLPDRTSGAVPDTPPAPVE